MFRRNVDSLYTPAPDKVYYSDEVRGLYFDAAADLVSQNRFRDPRQQQFVADYLGRMFDELDLIDLAVDFVSTRSMAKKLGQLSPYEPINRARDEFKQADWEKRSILGADTAEGAEHRTKSNAAYFEVMTAVRSRERTRQTKRFKRKRR